MKILPILELISQELDNQKFQIQGELDGVIQKYESMGMVCWIYLRADGKSINVASIKIPNKTDRKRGLGSALMGEITQLCDKYNLLCTLTPAGEETPMTVLLRFYKSFGFVPNKGRNKDFKFIDSMIRYPK